MPALPFVGLTAAYQSVGELLIGTGYVKWFDIDFGQGINSDDEYVIEYPAALLRCDDVIWQGTTEDGSRRGVLTISIKIICKLLSEEDWYTPLGYRNEVLAYYEMLSQIHSVVETVHSDSLSDLKLFNQFHVKTPLKEKLWVQVLQYRCNIQTNGMVDNPDDIVISVDSLQNDNDYLERKEYNLMNK